MGTHVLWPEIKITRHVQVVSCRVCSTIFFSSNFILALDKSCWSQALLLNDLLAMQSGPTFSHIPRHITASLLTKSDLYSTNEIHLFIIRHPLYTARLAVCLSVSLLVMLSVNICLFNHFKVAVIYWRLQWRLFIKKMETLDPHSVCLLNFQLDLQKVLFVCFWSVYSYKLWFSSNQSQY